uniref:Uncharacterized protein n=1 Tax=Acrobeloides nanus TaxID=290746 RepID=A0A914EER3_9BILA
MSLRGKVAVVTGASRGVGRGIALQLGEAGAKVYITGRDPKNKNVDLGLLTLEQTAAEITQRGGKGVAVYVDHKDDSQVEKLFEQIARENNGQLDILVNNAFGALDSASFATFKPFWEQETSVYDSVNNVGLRSYYVASAYAARIFVKNGRGGLIVNISSVGAKTYLFNVAYGVGKAGVDKLTADSAIELKPHKATVVSLWPGQVKTEVFEKVVQDDKHQTDFSKLLRNGLNSAESAEYSGKAIVALASDPNIFDKTGKVLLTYQLGQEYDFKDIDGREIVPNEDYEKLLKN